MMTAVDCYKSVGSLQSVDKHEVDVDVDLGDLFLCFLHVWRPILIVRHVVVQGILNLSEREGKIPCKQMQQVMVVSKTTKECPILCRV